MFYSFDNVSWYAPPEPENRRPTYPNRYRKSKHSKRAWKKRRAGKGGSR